MNVTLSSQADTLKQANLVEEVMPWRPIHYLGSKLRALSSIQEALLSVAPADARVYDIFAGSGTVSRWLSQSRPVVAVDVQEFSRTICSALLKPSEIDFGAVETAVEEELLGSRLRGSHFVAEPLIALEEEAIHLASTGQPTLLADLLEAGSLMTYDLATQNGAVRAAYREANIRASSLKIGEPRYTMVLRHFGGLYFSFRQAAVFDSLLAVSHRVPVAQRDSMVAAVLSCASDLVNTVGKQFAQPIRPRNKQGQIKSNLYGLAARDRFRNTQEHFYVVLKKYTSLKSTSYDCRAVRSDYRDFLLSNDFADGIVYADPPYTRDHYSRFYHVLETMSLWDDPIVSTNTVRGRTSPSRGVYREQRHQSPFCIRSQAPLAFNQMFDATAKRGVPIVLSYSPYAAEKDAHPRVMTIDAIKKIADRHYSNVEVISIGDFVHSKLNRSGLHKATETEAEFLIICRNAC